MWRALRVVAVNVVVFAVLLEAALHVYNPLRSTVRHDRVVLNVNNRIEVRNHRTAKLPPVVTFSTNSLGFRGPEPPADFAGSLTILAIGGSTTEEFNSDDDRTWAAQLSRELSPHFRDLWLNNAGLAGHSTIGHIVLVRDYVAKLKPKVVVFLVGLNDVGNAQDFEAFEKSYNFLYNAPEPSWRQTLISTLLRSELVSVAVTLKRWRRAARFDLPYNPDFDIRARPHRPLPPTAIRERLEMAKARLIPPYVRRLERLIALCESNGILAVFVTQPALYGEGTDPVTGIDLETITVGDANGKAAWMVLQLYNRALKDLGARRGITVVDLAARLPKRSDLYYDLVHYTEGGNVEVGRIVAHGIRPVLEARFADLRRAGR